MKNKKSSKRKGNKIDSKSINYINIKGDFDDVINLSITPLKKKQNVTQPAIKSAKNSGKIM